MLSTNHQQVLEKVKSRIAPVWPIKNFVAVNPYAGFTDTPFQKTAHLYNSRGAIRMTMPISFYIDLFQSGKIQKDDLRKSIEKSDASLGTVTEFIQKAIVLRDRTSSSTKEPYNLIDVASRIDGKNWEELLVDRISFWASANLDEHVSTWKLTQEAPDLFKAWKSEAEIDRSPEVMGLKGFRSSVKLLPDNTAEFLEKYLSEIKLDSNDLEAYLHALLLKLNGWSSYFSGVDFHDGLYSENEEKLTEFLAILLAWENYFLNHSESKEQVRSAFYKNWHSGEYSNAEKFEHTQLSLIFQDALDRSSQRELKSLFAEKKTNKVEHAPIAQMAFCIDVRSEVYRRNLENVNPQIETIGFAGFFGLPINYIPLAHNEGKNQCPVLLPSAYTVKESCEHHEAASERRKLQHQVSKTWKKFKSGAISSFGFVSPLGITFLPKILLDSFHITRPTPKPNEDGIGSYLKQGKTLDLSEISLEDKITMAAGALTGMGIKDRLAPLVLIAGHGSSSTNNPHASGLDCGACGGHSGEINALTAQYIFNDPEVRNGLAQKGIKIPEDTVFVACLHDTTTDDIHFVNEGLIPTSQQSKLTAIKNALVTASKNTRLERALRMNIEKESASKKEEEIRSRANDWSQIRPEWGLAGCHSFIVAPRKRTRDLNLDGKSFLHNYDWNTDSGFKILESIMTAPMVVTSWINLQYYASTTDNVHFGAGNKTLHNITSGIGVLEGSSGDLRIGLPLQSVHDGEKYQHIPIRLNVVIEAPLEAINAVLEKHENVRQLFDNEWIYLHRMNESGTISHTYSTEFQWNRNQEEVQEQKQSILQTL